MKSLFILSILLVLTLTCNAQFGSYGSYYPLQTGNTWYYKSVDHWMQQYFFKVTIKGDTVAGGINYFVRQRGAITSWVRFDTASGNLLEYNAGGGCNGYTYDRIIDSISSSPGNVVYCQNAAIYTRRCEMTGTESVLGSNRNVRKFEHDGLVLEDMMYADGIGVYYSSTSEPPPNTSYTVLLGCRINGVVYGDTTMSSVSEIGQERIDYHGGLINYPNPFNPMTVIEFNVNVVSETEAIIAIYNSVGTLVDRISIPITGQGKYLAKWDASQMPSGVYYYSVNIGDKYYFSRMVLRK